MPKDRLSNRISGNCWSLIIFEFQYELIISRNSRRSWFMTQRTYSLSDIYQAKKENQFSLPTVQRGFVWKPYQIENLWDSLLRGYPVGSIVLSPKIDKSGFEILDGQQRLSSICLGMYNPDSPGSSDVFKTSYDNIRVFIDLAKPDSDDNRKYIFRIVTRSHPWGYNRKDNKKPLESKEKRQFLEKLKI